MERSRARHGRRTLWRTGGAALAAAAVLGGCTHGLFSGVAYPDRTRPVARIETMRGVEYGATTSEGVLFLGRTATDGPCRVHYFLGPRAVPLVEDGEVRHLGGSYYLAEIDLKTQAVPILARDPGPDDTLVAVRHLGGGTRNVPVRLAQREGVTGDVLEWPGEDLPAGTGVFAVFAEEDLRFVGLVAGEATVESADGSVERFLVFTGTDRLREMLATPRPHPTPPEVTFRPDDITVVK